MTLDEVCTRREALKKIGGWLGRGAAAVAGAYTATSLADYLSDNQARADESQAATTDVPAVVNMYPWDHVAMKREQILPRKQKWWKHSKEDWIERYHTHNYSSFFRDPALADKVMDALSDSRPYNYELNFVMLTDQDELLFNIWSPKHGIPYKGKHVYICYARLGHEHAEVIRRNSPEK